MKKIIADVISRYGLSILRDEHRFCSIIDDLAPDKQDERKILHRMCYNHFLTYLYDELLPTAEPEKIQRFTLILKREGYSSEWTQSILQMFGLAESPSNAEPQETVNKQVRQMATGEPIVSLILQDAVVSSSSIYPKNSYEIEAIILRKGVVHVKAAAFAKMDQLRYVYVGETVETIGKGAFADCPNLQFVELSGKKVVFSDGVFRNSNNVCIVGDPCYNEFAHKNRIAMIATDCALLTEVQAVLGQYEAPDKELVNKWCKAKKGPYGELVDALNSEEVDHVFSPDSVSKVEYSTYGNAFIPKGYREINVSFLEFSDYLMNSMKSLTIPDGVVRILGSLNKLCRHGNLKRIYIPSTVEQISTDLFNGCDQLSILCPPDAPIRKDIKSMGRNPKSVGKQHFSICE